MENTIKSRIFELVEVNFGKFQMGLLPGIENILGVRLPNLRNLQKKSLVMTGADLYLLPKMTILKKPCFRAWLLVMQKLTLMKF